ncbi:hypothetical protein ASH04_06940 [Rhodococcus sp. Leaf233]|nr:hypothetical protein ASH04_06940 [Rhodococcus sp. Leaf233]
MVDMWIKGANARATRVAPCLLGDNLDEDKVAEAKLILVGAIIRWEKAGAGALQSRAAGSYSETLDTRQRTGYNFWPSEITQLQDICRSGEQGKAYSVDTVGSTVWHSPICSLYFGGSCSCGAVIAGVPIYEP